MGKWRWWWKKKKKGFDNNEVQIENKTCNHHKLWKFC